MKSPLRDTRFITFVLASIVGCAGHEPRGAVPLIPPQQGSSVISDALLARFDIDRDARFSRDEMAFTAIELFYSLDRDDDLRFTREEAGQFWNVHSNEVDANDDGALSLTEVLRDQEGQFTKFDNDNDDLLSIDEIRQFVSSRLSNETRSAQDGKAHD